MYQFKYYTQLPDNNKGEVYVRTILANHRRGYIKHIPMYNVMFLSEIQFLYVLHSKIISQDFVVHGL